MRKRKMWFTAGAAMAVAGAVCLLRSEYEREQLVIDRTVIKTDKITKDCTFVFLSDLHNHEFGVKNERLFAAIEAVNPDCILIGGDMMVSREGADLRVPVELIRGLAARYPVFYGNGNHETRMKRERQIYGRQYEDYVHLLQSLGVKYLQNSREPFENGVSICGIDLEERYYKKFSHAHLKAEEITKKAGDASQDRFQILLCHSPLFFDACRQWGADLTLSGHFHGGTIRLPYLGGVMTPQYQFFVPCCAGTFEEDGKYMIVSRGLGTHSINIRLNNKPSVVVVELRKEM